MKSTLELTDIGLSYFAALIDGLRLVNERAGGPDYVKIDPLALMIFVQTRGKQIHKAYLATPDHSTTLNQQPSTIL